MDVQAPTTIPKQRPTTRNIDNRRKSTTMNTKSVFNLTIFSLLLTGCAHTSSIPQYHPPPSNIGACEKLYKHILTATAITSFSDSHFNAQEKDAAISLLDEQFQSQGTTQKFFSFCMNKMNLVEVSCGLDSMSLEEMNGCKRK